MCGPIETLFLLKRRGTRRDLPQSGPRVHPRDHLHDLPQTFQSKAIYANRPCENVLVSAPEVLGLHPCSGRVSSRHQATGHRFNCLACLRILLRLSVLRQNLLVNPETVELKLCDFGSAKQLVQGEPNVSYICSRYFVSTCGVCVFALVSALHRYYRAPECIIGATHYNTQVGAY